LEIVFKFVPFLSFPGLSPAFPLPHLYYTSPNKASKKQEALLWIFLTPSLLDLSLLDLQENMPDMLVLYNSSSSGDDEEPCNGEEMTGDEIEQQENEDFYSPTHKENAPCLL
jgi:hypothetical protein